MRRVKVTDISCEEVATCRYDWLVVGAGSESRSTHVATELARKHVYVKRILVLCFPDVKAKVRRSILSTVKQLSSEVEEVELESDAHDKLYQILNERFLSEKVEAILVDYSGMSRVWYAAILFWFYQVEKALSSVRFIFLYAEGIYAKDFVNKNVVIKEVRAIPGCEGLIYRQAPTTLVLGFGFYGYASLCVCDQLEPDELYTFSTIEEPLKRFPIDKQEGNQELETRALMHFKIPMSSVEMAYRCLSNVTVMQKINGNELILVPMGPKTHVLAAILVALSNRDVCVMRVRHDQYPNDVKPEGKIVACEIRFSDINNFQRT